MRFVNPLALFLLVVVPLLLYLRYRRQQPAVISYPTLQDLRALPRTFAVWLHRAMPVLRALALILCVVALARPQWGFETTEVRRQGIAIDMVVDTSRSMAALDLELEGEERDRLEVVKEAFRLFVLGEGENAGGREGDLIGMVTFARYADGVSPLTLDHDMLLSLLDQVEIVTLPEDNGTSIGEAMALRGGTAAGEHGDEQGDDSADGRQQQRGPDGAFGSGPDCQSVGNQDLHHWHRQPRHGPGSHADA